MIISFNKVREETALNVLKTPSELIKDCIAELAETSTAVIPYLPTPENLKQMTYREKRSWST